jgi:hypothetical protein
MFSTTVSLSNTTVSGARERSQRRAELVKACRRLASLASLEANDTPKRDERARITRLVPGCDDVTRKFGGCWGNPARTGS